MVANGSGHQRVRDIAGAHGLAYHQQLTTSARAARDFKAAVPSGNRMTSYGQYQGYPAIFSYESLYELYSHYRLNSLKGVIYIRDYIGQYYRIL